MKLVRLQLSEGFRSLPAGFEVRFFLGNEDDNPTQFNPYCLVGRNGSGKSNLLEALSAIFFHLECIYLEDLPDTFLANEEELDGNDSPIGFSSAFSYPDSFELEYLIKYSGAITGNQGQTLLSNEGNALVDNSKTVQVSVTKTKGERPAFAIKGWQSEQKAQPITERQVIRQLLPDFVLGYSSGENEILSLPFYKMRLLHYDEYIEKLTNKLSYGGAPEGRMVYLDEALSQAIILCNFLYQEEETLAPFKEDIGLEDIKEFRIILNNDIEELLVSQDFKKTLTRDQMSDDRNLKVFLTDLLNPSIDKLFDCATTSYTDAGKGFNYLDFWVNDETKEAFRFHFGSALELFQVFQMLFTLNLHILYDDPETKDDIYRSDKLYISKALPKPARKDRIIRFGDFMVQKSGVSELIPIQSMSDGEHQFLHTLGLCLLFKDQQCLYLLDEPETHLNPDWRSKFISRLRDCFMHGEAEEEVMREMLITSHSPFIVSDSRSENVLLFERLAESQVKCSRPSFKTFGASVNQITMGLFEKSSTIGGYAGQQLRKLEKRFEAGEDGEKLIDEANKLLGDSVEKILFIDKVLDALDDKSA